MRVATGWLLRSSLVLLLPVAAAAANEDLRVLDGLIERQLFGLAEYLCQQRMQDDTVDVTTQGEYARGLIRAYADQSRFVRQDERAAIWRKIDRVVHDFESRHGENPQVLLVRLQAALAQVARGEIAFEEFARWKQTAAVNEISLEALTAAVQQLERLKEDIAKAVRERGRAAFGGGRLTDQQLRLLQGHVQFYLVKAFHLQAEGFPPGSPDRLLAAATALEHSKLLAPADVTDAMWWENRLREVQCHRLREDWQAAAEHLQRLEPLAPGSEQRLALRAEVLRTALAQGKVDQALNLLTQGRELDGLTSPQLDLAHLETYLHLWQQAQEQKDDDRSDWQAQAMKLVELIQAEHGPRWGRLAVMMTADRFGAEGLSQDIEDQMTVAETYYRQGQFGQAVAAYDQAVSEAQRSSLDTAAFDLAYRAAAIVHEHGDRAEAARRFRQMAMAAPKHARAAHAHWIGVLHAAREAADSPDALAHYQSQLHEHLQLWPNATSAHQARWWLARLHESRQQWKEAARWYIAGRGEAVAWAEAVLRSAHCWDQYFATKPPAVDGSDPQWAPELAEALEGFSSWIATLQEPRPDVPAMVADAALLGHARLHVHYDAQLSAAVVDRLAARLADATAADPQWRSAAQRVLLAARVRQNDRSGAQELLRQFERQQPSVLWDWMLRVGRRPEFDQRTLGAEIILELASQLQSGEGQTESDHKQWQRLHAKCLALTGKHKQAIEQYRELATEYPDDVTVQQTYGRLLLDHASADQWPDALQQWRKILARSRPASDLWFEAKLSVARVHLEMNEPQQAEQILQLVRALHPTLGGAARRAEFEVLLDRCRQAAPTANAQE